MQTTQFGTCWRCDSKCLSCEDSEGRRSIACARARDDTAFDARWMTRQGVKCTVERRLESEVAQGKRTLSGHTS